MYVQNSGTCMHTIALKVYAVEAIKLRTKYQDFGIKFPIHFDMTINENKLKIKLNLTDASMILPDIS